MSEAPPLLQVRNLRTWFEIRRSAFGRAVGHVKAVDGVDFEIAAGEVLGLAGESGSGKTTVGRSLLRLVEPTNGEIIFDGQDVRALTRRELRLFRRRAQLVFQDPFGSLDPRMTIAEIVAEPLVVQGEMRTFRAARERVGELLGLVALGTEYLDRRPDQLSGGQRQRVGIARALAVRPQFLVADEPVSALDVSIQAQIVNLFAEIKQRFGLALLFISHDIAVMAHLADRIAVMYLGRIMEIGPARDVVARPQHPYTRALLSAVPSPDPDRPRQRQILEGDLPSPSSPPSGCVFRTRCPVAIAACAAAVPPLLERAPGHRCACIRSEVVSG